MNEDLKRELALLRDLGYTHLDLELAGRGSQVTEEPAPAPALPATRDPRPTTPESLFAPRDSTLEPDRRNVDPARAASSEQRAADPEQRAANPPLAQPTSAILTAPNLDVLGTICAPCTRCRLATTRTQVVFGVGDPNADLMFVGEAPGRDEDLKGEPFVGRAGQLLTDIIKAMKLSRDQVYIANVIKCRPPENRNPEPDELEACRPYIRRQIELIQPKVIVTLGRYAVQSLTGKSYAISAVRGQWQEYEGIKVMPTYHPAYLLRTPSAKKEVWADMKKVMSELGIQF